MGASRKVCSKLSGWWESVEKFVQNYPDGGSPEKFGQNYRYGGFRNFVKKDPDGGSSKNLFQTRMEGDLKFVQNYPDDGRPELFIKNYPNGGKPQTRQVCSKLSVRWQFLKV